MIYTVFPTNLEAKEAVQKASAAIDGRLSLPDEEKASVVSFLLGHRHLETIHCPSHAKVTKALVDADVIGRTKGTTNFFVKAPFKDLSGLTFATHEDGSVHAFAVTKSGLWCRTRKAAESASWSDIAGLGYGAAYYFGIVDLAATVAAFREGAAPCVSFLQCDYEKHDDAGAKAFVDLFVEQAFLSGVAVAPIQSEGAISSFVVEQPDRALLCLNAATTKFLNRAGPRFAVVTRDRYAREVRSYGSYL